MITCWSCEWSHDKDICSVNMASSEDLVLAVSAAAGTVAGIMLQESGTVSNVEDDNDQR